MRRLASLITTHRRIFTRVLAAIVLSVVLIGPGAPTVSSFLSPAPLIAHAATTTNPATFRYIKPIPVTKPDFGIVQNAILAILDAVQWFLSWLLTNVSEMAVWMINYGTTIISFPAVKAGFNVTLSLINLMFVMTLIIIAFQIILGYHEGDAKKKLALLIIAAVLVNFSLLIAGLLLDVSNVFTNFFIDSVTPQNIKIALDPDKFVALTAGAGTVMTFTSVLTGHLLSMLMTGLILVAMIAVLATAIVRNLWVACLLLTMPLTWALWVFPGLSKYHHDWWENFMKWGVTVLPTITFFIYLAIETANEMSAQGIANSASNDTLASIIQVLLVCGIMVAGLKIGQAAGGITATAALSAAGKTAAFAAKPITSSRWGKAVGRSTAGFGSRVLSRINNIPFVGAATSAVGLGAAANYLGEKSHASHAVEDVQKTQLAGLSNERLFAFTARGAVEQAAKLAEIGKRKQVNEFLQRNNQYDAAGNVTNPAAEVAARNELAALAQASIGANHAHTDSEVRDIAGMKEMLEANPSLAPQVFSHTDPRTGQPRTDEQLIRDQFNRMSPSKIAELGPGTFNQTTLEGRLALQIVGTNEAAIRAIFTNGSEGLRNTVMNNYNRVIEAAFPAGTPEHAAVTTQLVDIDTQIRIAKDNNADAATLSGLRGQRTARINTARAAIAGIADADLRARVQGAVNGFSIQRQAIPRETGIV